MARRRFFVSEVRRGEAELSGTDAEHLVRVLRVEAGQLFEISDNQRAYLAQVQSARKSSVVFRVKEQLPDEPPGVYITLCPALIKFDRFEWLVEKATELGVEEVLPFAAIRTDHGLWQASQKRVERWRRIGMEASQQSRRTRLPVIHDAQKSAELVRVEASVKLLLDEEPEAAPILNCLPERREITDQVALMLGPEGGWTEGERAFLVAEGWHPCSLGRSILRAETAAIAGLAVLQAAWLK